MAQKHCTSHPNDDNKNPFSSSLPNRFEFIDHGRHTRNSPNNNVNSDTFDSSASAKVVNPRRKSESYSVSPTARAFNPQGFDYSLYSPSNQIHSNYADPNWAQYQQFQPSPYFQMHSTTMDKKIVLYKTEMCRTFEETGTCKYGVKCQFAHDPAEIRAIPRHPRYKTEICKTFWQLGNCPYGKRCCFIHTENELRGKSDSNEASKPASSDVFGSVETLLIDEIATEIINSHNSSRPDSPDYLSNLKHSNSSIKLSFLPRRRKSIIDDRIEELSGMVQKCTVTSEASESLRQAEGELSANDPRVIHNITSSTFNLWAAKADSPDNSASTNGLIGSAATKFVLFDKSPGSRAIQITKPDIWASGNNSSSFLLSSQQASECDVPDSAAASDSSSRSSESRQHLLTEMIHLLDAQ